MTEFRGQKFVNGIDIRPHVSIVMNFTRPTETKPALLTYGEVETFLHEFGHALHGMLTKCHYESLSGTNVYRDFVELPSQIMENWVQKKSFSTNLLRTTKQVKKFLPSWYKRSKMLRTLMPVTSRYAS